MVLSRGLFIPPHDRWLENDWRALVEILVAGEVLAPNPRQHRS